MSEENATIRIIWEVQCQELTSCSLICLSESVRRKLTIPST